MRIYVTRQGDMVDAIASRAYGSEHNGTTEAILAANPGLADRGPVLPENIEIKLPDISPAQVKRLPTVDLWS